MKTWRAKHGFRRAAATSKIQEEEMKQLLHQVWSSEKGQAAAWRRVRGGTLNGDSRSKLLSHHSSQLLIRLTDIYQLNSLPPRTSRWWFDVASPQWPSSAAEVTAPVLLSFHLHLIRNQSLRAAPEGTKYLRTVWQITRSVEWLQL